jgi:hypothetical protein
MPAAASSNAAADLSMLRRPVPVAVARASLSNAEPSTSVLLRLGTRCSIRQAEVTQPGSPLTPPSTVATRSTRQGSTCVTKRHRSIRIGAVNRLLPSTDRKAELGMNRPTAYDIETRQYQTPAIMIGASVTPSASVFPTIDRTPAIRSTAFLLMLDRATLPAVGELHTLCPFIKHVLRWSGTAARPTRPSLPVIGARCSA